jgi:hypothetical protein
MALSKIKSSSMADTAIHGRRNLIINGAYQCWQRGTSFSSNGYGADRWKLYAPSGHSYSRSTDTPDFFQYSASVGGGGDATGLTQFVESANSQNIPSSGSETITLSFYLKHTTNSGTDKITSVVGTLDSADNSGASTNRSTKNHTTTTSWARYTHEMTGADLTTAVTNGLAINIKHNGSGTTAFLITGVQLEIGKLTPFEHRSFGEELALCQRYFEKSFNAVTPLGTAGQAGVISVRQAGANAVPSIFYKQAKRASATMTIYSAATGASGKARDNDGAVDITIAILNNGETHCTVVLNGTDSNYLHFHYAADAEL